MTKDPKGAAPGTIKSLHAGGPNPDLEEKLNLFGQFVGDWEIETEWFLPHGERRTGKGEVHVGWILDGTAIQDVWKGRVDNPPPGSSGTSIGTTIRFYDPKLDAWRCIWTAPNGGVVQTFVARQVGNEIILEGETPDGHPEQWIFSEVTPRSFSWRSVESHDHGGTWQLTERALARRVGDAGRE